MTSQTDDRVIDFHLMGQVDYDEGLQLQRRLVYEARGSLARRIVVLVCEHPWLISVGRSGSRAHIRYTQEQLEHERLKVRWVHRGGGCILHGPSQLAIYPIVNLERLGWTAGSFVQLFQQSLRQVLDELQIQTRTVPGSSGVWGRSGLLAAMGLAVQNGVTSHGAYLNVNPAMQRFGFVDCVPPESVRGRATMSCLLAERRQPARMSKVRSALVETLAGACDVDRHHLHSGHPWLRPRLEPESQKVARAS